MMLTHSFIGIKKGDLDYLFFLVTEDYIESHRRLNDEISPLLEEFGRDLKARGAVVRPFSRDIAETRTQIRRKFESGKLSEKGVVHFADNSQTPGLLIINKDFDSFNPDNDPWFYISFRDYINDFGNLKVFDLKGLLDYLTRLTETGKDLFMETKKHVDSRDGKAKEAHKMVELKPGVFGFSVDLKEVYGYFKK